MNRFCKRLLCGILALGMAFCLTANSPAHAGTGTPPAAPALERGRHTYYLVYYRMGPNHPWMLYAWFSRHSDAEVVARWIRSYGYETFIGTYRA